MTDPRPLTAVEKSFEALRATFDDTPPEVLEEVTPALDEIARLLAEARKP